MRGEDKEMESTAASAIDLKYRFTGYHKFVDPEGYPAIAPPWGTLNAINLNTGEYAWKIPLGEYPELAAKGLTIPGQRTTAVRLGGLAGCCFLHQPTLTRSHPLFTRPRAACGGGCSFHFPVTPRPVRSR